MKIRDVEVEVNPLRHILFQSVIMMLHTLYANLGKNEKKISLMHLHANVC